MSAPDEKDAAQWEDERYAGVMRRRFGVEVDRRATAPPPRESDEPDEDEQFAAFMDRHFPGGRSGR